MKKCIYCKEIKSETDFSKHSHTADNLDTRCKDCIKKQTEIRKELYKFAPPKPNKCQCCGKKSNKWCLDHNHTDNTFRGWICDRCNTGIGNLGDDLKGLMKAIRYLKRTMPKKVVKIPDRQLKLFES